MPAQKRPSAEEDDVVPTDPSSPPRGNSPPPATAQTPPSPHQQEEPPKEEERNGEEDTGGGEGDVDGDGDSDSIPGSTDEFVLVKLSEIRKDVQCPICLGIIRKTRTVMECLHRFCRECIDKSMRLGNNECPACRTHCASRRSLRDDPNYDALIAALYPDIDKYEEEELAFHEEEKNRNKKIQASIAETLRRQTEALGKRRTSSKSARKPHGNYRYLRGRGRSNDRVSSLPGSEEEDEEDANDNDARDSSSAEEPSPERRQKRRRRLKVPRSSPAKTAGNTDADGEENDEIEENRGRRGTSPLRAGNRELTWGRGGVRSHSRSSGSNGRYVRAARMNRLAEHLRNSEVTDDKFNIHLTLLPLDEQSTPKLQRPYICCGPTLPISHLCQYIAPQISKKAEDIQIYVRKPQTESLEVKPSIPVAKSESDPLENLQVVDEKETLSLLRESFTGSRGELVLVYCTKGNN